LPTLGRVVGFASSPRFVEHDTGPHHPERPDRIRAIYRAMIESGLLDIDDPFPDFPLKIGLKPLDRPKLKYLQPAPADESLLLLCHDPRHVERIKHVCSIGGGILDSGDTPVGPDGHEIALLSLGSAIRAADAVMSAEVARCFSAARPPGHHAEPDRAMGFCLYCNVAIAARYVQRRYAIQRVAIVDFDVHHGNGTQACVEDDASIFFVSMHQHPRTCYPGSGHDWEIGVGPARGYKLNLPFDPGCGDEEYLRVMDARVIPELDDFAPQVLFISAGFDAHREDPLAQMGLSDAGYEFITRSLVDLSNHHCQGRVISVLEGGYNLAALGRSVVRHLLAMS
jgi:acetoin utilization deacetylase AcuC-like enzyme